ncbi:hypothetical protein Tco_0658518 [Tanacetum coccineum]
MAQLKYCDKHNQVGFLRKPDESAGFAEIVDFLRGSNLRYALTSNPTIYDSLVKQFWQSATANTKANGSLEINATIDTIRKGFSRGRPLLPSMLLVATNPNAGQEHAAVAQSQPSSSTPQAPTPPPITTPTPPPITTPTPPPITTPTPPPITTPTPPPITTPTPPPITTPTPPPIPTPTPPPIPTPTPPPINAYE